MPYTPLISEILEKVAKAKTKDKKVELLRQHNSDSLRMIIKSSFDPNIKWQLPDGDVPYTTNEAPEGTEHTILAGEAKELYHYIAGGNPQLTQNKPYTESTKVCQQMWSRQRSTGMMILCWMMTTNTLLRRVWLVVKDKLFFKIV